MLIISIEILWIFYLVSKTLKSGLLKVGNFSPVYRLQHSQDS